MSNTSRDWEEKFREKMEELERKLRELEDVKREVERLRARAREDRERSIRIRIGEEDLEPGVEIATNLAKMIRDSIRRSFAQLGEDTLSDIIDEMPEDMASEAMKNVSIPDRVKILKLLYYGPRSYGEIASSFPEGKAKSSLQYHLQQLRNVNLIRRNEVSGDYEITSRGRSLLRLMAIFYGALRGGDLEESRD